MFKLSQHKFITMLVTISIINSVLVLPSYASEREEILIYDKRVAAKIEFDGVYIRADNDEFNLIFDDKVISVDDKAFATFYEMSAYIKSKDNSFYSFLISRLTEDGREEIFEFVISQANICKLALRDHEYHTFIIGYYDIETNTLCAPHGIVARGFKSGYVCGYLPKITDGIDLSIDKDNHRIEGTAQTDIVIGNITVNEEDFIAIEPISPDIISEANCFTMPMADKAAIGPAYLMIEGTVYPFGLITDFDEDTGIFKYSHFGLSFYFKFGGFALGLSGAGVYQEGYFVGSIDKASISSWNSGIGRLASYEINTYLRNK